MIPFRRKNMATRWLSQVAREDYICPKCNAALGAFCQTPSGRQCNGTGGVHSERINLVPRAVAIAECSATLVSIHDIIAKAIKEKGNV